MKSKVFFLCALFLLIITVPPVQAGVPEGAELAQLVEGRWSITNETPAAEMTTDYRNDGTFMMHFNGSRDGKPVSLSFEGTWKISGRTLARTVTKTSLEKALKVGDEEKLEIQSIDTEQMKYKVSGKILIETRVKEQPERDGSRAERTSQESAVPIPESGN
jgi:hypothetical protein